MKVVTRPFLENGRWVWIAIRETAGGGELLDLGSASGVGADHSHGLARCFDEFMGEIWQKANRVLRVSRFRLEEVG